jgi:sodium/proline symporter
MLNGVTISFFVFLAGFVAIGIYSATKKKATADDYLLASRSVHPWLAALSAVATDNSGFMFMGLTGSCYLHGVSGGWLIVGWIFGEWIAWLFVHRRLREGTERVGANTISGFLGNGLRGGWLVGATAGVITLFFLGIYAAAQLTAGSKALSQFDIDTTLGVVLGASIVLAYCFSGGLRASIWTDAAQSVVMLISMLLLIGVAVQAAGGPGALWDTLAAVRVTNADGAVVDAGLTDFTPSYQFGFGLFLLGWVAAGFGMVGQPHIMVRAMAIDSADNMPKARRIYITWYIFFALACIGVGLAARALLPWEADVGRVAQITGDHELAFPALAGSMLGPVLVGMMLAGLFAATISTADSQVLSCSAALSQDVLPRLGKSYNGVKAATLIITGVALTIALYGGSVFAYVTFAWSGLASSLGPLLVVRSMGWRLTGAVAMAMILVGLATVLIWLFALQLSGAVYEAAPGMASGFLVYLLWAATTGGIRERA